ncbi:MAG: SAM-dependent methyltransferase, partial [Crocinitomicaceae bacterium]
NGYNYFKGEAIKETESGTYADPAADIETEYVTLNQDMSEVIMSLFNAGIEIKELHEFDYSPYDCFRNTDEFEPGKYRIKHLANKIPMVYSLRARKN